jgi:uncharacterized membrane protein YraQ (UPF0718 family)
MLISTLLMGGLALILLGIGYYRGEGQHVAGLKFALKVTVQIVPLLIFAFIVAGMVEVLVPREALARWIGAESGFKGILLATLAGGVCPGGPYVSLPIVAGLLRSGASIGVVVAFLTSWSLWAVARLPMEVGILGWRVTLIRVASTFFFPPIAGLIARLMFRGTALAG